MENLPKKALLDVSTQVCDNCGGRMSYKGSGRYYCEECGNEYLTDFGKVKLFLEENGPSNALVISDSTGVSRRTISEFLQSERLEVVGQIDEFKFCSCCGAAIRSGTLCSNCAQRLEKDRGNGVYTGVLAEREDGTGEMRFNKPNKNKK